MSWHLAHVEETESTNLLARSGRPNDVFTASFQTAGRGRLDHRWFAERGKNLMMSVVLDVGDLVPEHVATLPLAVGLAVVKALHGMAPRLMLKWPNDVLCDGRKLAGILCERHGDNALAGIGVNVQQHEFPSEIAGRATSLALLGSDASVAEVRDAVLSALSQVIAVWRTGFSVIYSKLIDIDYLAGRQVAICQLDDVAPSAYGICGGIQPDGSLLVGGDPVWAGEAHVCPV